MAAAIASRGSEPLHARHDEEDHRHRPLDHAPLARAELAGGARHRLRQQVRRHPARAPPLPVGAPTEGAGLEREDQRTLLDMPDDRDGKPAESRGQGLELAARLLFRAWRDREARLSTSSIWTPACLMHDQRRRDHPLIGKGPKQICSGDDALQRELSGSDHVGCRISPDDPALAWLERALALVGVLAACATATEGEKATDALHALLVTMGYVVVNTLFGNILEPSLMGRRLGLSTLVVILSLLFWGWAWGPLGALLSVPLTVIVKIWLENTHDLKWVAILLDKSPPAMPVSVPPAPVPIRAAVSTMAPITLGCWPMPR
mgnify:CR=1 FL=1